ncbi:MAG: hypothetical protein J2P21_12340 [Chloracidobacterium sp.]|nr:hypothetical protein [Chloracidobacterium sp.]
MNDYLTNLAARSLNPAPALRPRLRSRFDPVSPDPAKPLASTPDRISLEKETETPYPSAIARDALRSGALAAPAPAPAPTEDENETIGPPIGPPRETSMRGSSMPADETTIARTHAHALSTIRPEPIGIFRNAAEDRAALDRSAPEIVESNEAEAAVQTSPLKTRRPQRDPRMHAEVLERVVINEVIERREPGQIDDGALSESLLPAPKRSAISSQVIAQPRVTPFLEYRGEEKAAPPAPTVHVTIGRVEVRATQLTPQSSPKPRPSRPTMSLDDYLRRRGEGGAR